MEKQKFINAEIEKWNKKEEIVINIKKRKSDNYQNKQVEGNGC